MIVLLVAVLPVQYAARAAIAAWLVPPTPSLTGPPAVESAALLQRAVALVPGSAVYHAYLAQQRTRELLAGWNTSLALDSADAAWQNARTAVELEPGNGFHHLLAGSIAVWKAAHPQTARPESWRRTASRQFAQARELLPFNPDAHARAGLDLLRIWSDLEPPQRAFALDALRRSAELDEGRLDHHLAAVWQRVGEPDRADATHQITPLQGGGNARLAGFLANRAPLDPGPLAAAIGAIDAGVTDTHDSAALQRLLDAGERLARAHPERLGPWAERWSTAPQLAPRVLAATVAMAAHMATVEQMLARAASIALTAGDPPATAVESAARRALADLEFRAGDPATAATLYERVLADAPNDTGTAAAAARAYLHLDRGEAAVRLLESSVRLAPAHPELRQLLAESYLATGRPMPAIRQLEARLGGDPDNFALRAQLARLYRDAGLWQQARDQFEAALALRPGDGTLRSELARLGSAGR